MDHGNSEDEPCTFWSRSSAKIPGHISEDHETNGTMPCTLIFEFRQKDIDRGPLRGRRNNSGSDRAVGAPIHEPRAFGQLMWRFVFNLRRIGLWIFGEGELIEEIDSERRDDCLFTHHLS
jgi:hypothetical protein